MRLLDFFFALRPLVLVPAWSFFLLGRAIGATPPAPFPGLRFALLSLVLAAAHLVNQVVDFESDRINGKGFFLQRGVFTRRLYVAAAAVGLAAGLGIGAWQRESPTLLVAAAALGLAYSVPPLRLAARPGFDLVANALGYGGIALLLGAGGMPAAPRWGANLAAAALAVAAVFLHTTLLDLEGDRRTGKRTSGVALGPGRTRHLAALLAFGAAASALVARAPLLAVPGLAIAALCTGAVLLPARVPSRSVCIGSTACFAAAAGASEPLFLVAMAALVLLTRLYYRHRFALAYPAL